MRVDGHQQCVVDRCAIGRERNRKRRRRDRRGAQPRRCADGNSHDCRPDVHRHASGSRALLVFDFAGKQDIGASGGTASVSVNTTSNCAWTGASNVSWITITSGASGTNDGTVTFNVAPNTGPKRKGSLTIAGRTAEVEQGDR